VYVAETSSDVRIERDRIRRELLQSGYRVLPDSPLPLETGPLQKAIREQLTRCRLSVHLTGRHYGVVPEGEDRSLIELQFDLAVERGASDPAFTRIVWTPPHLEASTDRQRAFLAGIETQAGRGTDLVKVGIEELKSVIVSLLRREPAARPSASPAARPLVYVIVDRRDEEAARDVCDRLFTYGFEVATPVWEGSEAEIRAEHESLLVTCDAALIYYGAVSEVWVRRQIQALQKSMSMRSGKTLTSAVVMGPPGSDAKRRFRTHAVSFVLDDPAQNADALKSFLDTLQHA
jgi:hypothetical protein